MNSAADFFVRRIDGWRDQLVELHRGARATIYRPNATLFLLLKIARLSATDLEDCIALLQHVASSNEPVDRKRVGERLRELPTSDDVALQQRRDHLLAALAD